MQIIPIAGLNATAWTMTSVCIVLTAGRFIIHWQKVRRFGWDDYFNAIALIWLLVFIITYQIFVPIEYQAELYAMGLSDMEPAYRDAILDMKLNYANIVAFFCVLYSVKASFLALYWRIFEVSRKFRIAWGALTAYTVLTFMISVLALFWNCGQPSKIMDPVACGARPRSLTVHLLTMWCVLNIIGDVALMILPIAMLKPMLMPLTQKLGLALVFGLVLIIITFDILRTVFTLKMRPDFQDENAIWAIMEPTIAVMVCALPCYRGLLGWGKHTIFSEFLSSLSSRWSNSSKRNLERTESRDSRETRETGKDSWLVREDMESGRENRDRV